MPFTPKEWKQLQCASYFGPAGDVLVTYLSLLINRQVSKEEMYEFVRLRASADQEDLDL